MDQTADAESLRQESDPGYYLIARGRTALEKETGCRVPFRTWFFRLKSNRGVMSYVGMIAIVTAIVLALALSVVVSSGIGGWRLLVLAIAGFVPASDVAVTIVKREITLLGGMLLPGWELRSGVTTDLRTIIVVPTMLDSIAEIDEQIERLESHHLSNADDNFIFALISDWHDSATERNANDESLLERLTGRAVASVHAMENNHTNSVSNNNGFVEVCIN